MGSAQLLLVPGRRMLEGNLNAEALVGRMTQEETAEVFRAAFQALAWEMALQILSENMTLAQFDELDEVMKREQ